MIEKAIEIGLPSGLVARPTAVLVQVASKYDCAVYIESGGRKINAKSIMGMMSLGLDSGEMVTVIADGQDEEDALGGIEEYLSKGKVS